MKVQKRQRCGTYQTNDYKSQGLSACTQHMMIFTHKKLQSLEYDLIDCISLSIRLRTAANVHSRDSIDNERQQYSNRQPAVYELYIFLGAVF